uniref:Uncharacterized protein n=1 Tax=Meloidogyne enterolobii TaxID=390850 RepID=A0A6V7VWU2_MELEN|nr:unnamed protein product [Meloidogyne enterolobii]
MIVIIVKVLVLPYVTNNPSFYLSMDVNATYYVTYENFYYV